MKIIDINRKENYICRFNFTNGKTSYGMVIANENMCVIGHPMTPKGVISSGRRTYHSEDIASVQIAPLAMQKKWLDGYKAWHEEIVVEKGYDACEENLSNYKFVDYTPNGIRALVEHDTQLLALLKNSAIEKTTSLLWSNGHDQKHPLALTSNIDSAYGLSIDEDEMHYERIGTVCVDQYNDLLFATRWDMENCLDMEDAFQYAKDTMSTGDCIELLASVNQQIELNNSKQN